MQVVYTCTPNCCFNHVCTDCGTTFETATRRAGGTLASIEPPLPPADASDPTAACAVCDSLLVCTAEDGRLVCAHCGALLILEISSVRSS